MSPARHARVVDLKEGTRFWFGYYLMAVKRVYTEDGQPRTYAEDAGGRLWPVDLYELVEVEPA